MQRFRLFSVVVMALSASLATAQPPPIVISPVRGGNCFGGYPTGSDHYGSQNRTFTIYPNDTNIIILTESQIWPATFPAMNPTAPFACYAYGADTKIAWLGKVPGTEFALLFIRPLWGRQEETQTLFKPYHPIKVAGMNATFISVNNIFTDGTRLFVAANVFFWNRSSSENVIFELSGNNLRVIYEAGDFSLSRVSNVMACSESIYFTQTLGREFYQLLQISKGKLQIVATSADPFHISCEGRVLINDH